MRYAPSWYLPSPHLRTLWGRFTRPAPDLAALGARVERVETPDGDFLDLVRVDAADSADALAPQLILLHGLEGGARSHYIAGLLGEAHRRGWGATLILFRGCGDEPNRARRFYHSGETEDLELVVAHVAARHPAAPLAAIGVSLGGNVLLKWLGERGEGAPLAAAAAVSVPYDLARAARHIDRGFSRIYQWSFLRSLKRKALAKLERFPDLADAAAVRAARSIWAFDDALTAPVHGFRDAHDYYARSSALGWLDRIRTPTLLLSAVDDPFLPAEVLDEVREIARGNAWLTVEFPPHGGHVGFVSGSNPLRARYWAEWRAATFIAERLDHLRGRRHALGGEAVVRAGNR